MRRYYDTDIEGISIICNCCKWFVGSYKRGLWCDDNEVFVNSSSKFGFKFDITFGRIVRPVPKFYSPKFWFDKTTFGMVPLEKYEEEFGKLAPKVRQLLELHPECKKYRIYNPWFGKRWFVLRLPRWIPTFFFSLNIGKSRFYIGFKRYEVDPFPPGPTSSAKDLVWTDERDSEYARENEPIDTYEALAPSATIRL